MTTNTLDRVRNFVNSTRGTFGIGTVQLRLDLSYAQSVAALEQLLTNGDVIRVARGTYVSNDTFNRYSQTRVYAPRAPRSTSNNFQASAY